MSSLVSLVSGIGHPATLRVLQDLLHAVSELPVVVDHLGRLVCLGLQASPQSSRPSGRS
jgi:hypothetical protein